MDDVLKLIDKLPQISNYIVPGYIYLLIHSFICSKKNSDYKYLFYKSVGISFLFYIITATLEIIIGTKFPPSVFSITEIAIAILVSFYLSRFYNSKLFGKVLDILQIRKTVSTNIWQDIHKHEKVLVKVYMNNDDKLSYYGELSLIEEKDENNYLSISNYQCRNCNGELIEPFTKDKRRTVIININDISRIEYCEYTENKSKE